MMNTRKPAAKAKPTVIARKVPAKAKARKPATVIARKPTAKAIARKPTAKAIARKPRAECPPQRQGKSDRLIELLRQSGGVSMLEITGAMGIQPHTARAQISVETRRRGLKAVRSDGRYSIAE